MKSHINFLLSMDYMYVTAREDDDEIDDDKNQVEERLIKLKGHV